MRRHLFCILIVACFVALFADPAIANNDAAVIPVPPGRFQGVDDLDDCLPGKACVDRTGAIKTPSATIGSADGMGIINGLHVGRGANEYSGNVGLGDEALISIAIREDAYTLGPPSDLFEVATETQSHENTGIGAYALNQNEKGSDNTGIGSHAMRDNVLGFYNTGIGHLALGLNTYGSKNTALGCFSLNNNKFGNSNLSLGFKALYYNLFGDFNSGVGEYALYRMIGGEYNVAEGYRAQQTNRMGSYNTMIGASSGYDLNPTYAAIQSFADYSETVAGTVKANSAAHGRSNGDSITIKGSVNYNDTYEITVIDENSFYFTETFAALDSSSFYALHYSVTETGYWVLAGKGAFNTFLGYKSGWGISTGSGNTVIGAQTVGLASDLTNNIVIANGAGEIKAQHDGTNWLMPGNLTITDGTAMTSGWKRTLSLKANYPVMVFDGNNTKFAGMGYDYTSGGGISWWINSGTSDVTGSSPNLFLANAGGLTLKSGDFTATLAGKGIVLKNAAGTVIKRVRLNDAGDGLIFEDP